MSLMDEFKKIIHPYDDEDYDYEEEQHFNDAFAVNNKHRCQSAEMQHDGEEKSAVRYAEDFLKQQEMTAA